MAKKLKGRTIAVLLTDGFEQIEMTEPKKALEEAGATVLLVASKETVQGWHHDKKGKKFKADVLLKNAKASDFDALLLPGGVKNPDALRLDKTAVRLVKGFREKPIAAICHGPWTLINAELVRDHTITSWPSLEADLKNAGAHWVNKKVVRSGNLVTSRKPADLPFFNKAIVAAFGK